MSGDATGKSAGEDKSRDVQPPFILKNVFKPLHLITVIVLFLLDQASKYAVVTYIQMGSRIEVISFMDFIHTKNRGAAFGMFHHSTPVFRMIFFGIVTLICLYYLIYLLGSTPLEDKFQRFCFSLILGGAFGNLYDRVVFGEVTDFVDVFFRQYHFYTFNIADSGITVGVTLLFLKWIPWNKVFKKAESEKS